MSNFSINANAVKELANLLKETDLTEISYETGGNKIKVSRGGILMSGPAMQSPLPVARPSSEKSEGAELENAVKSPMIGTAYMSPQPGSEPFIKVGDSVSKGQTLMILEAMKVMNQIKAPHSGIVKSILVKDGEPVEYGAHLCVIA